MIVVKGEWKCEKVMSIEHIYYNMFKTRRVHYIYVKMLAYFVLTILAMYSKTSIYVII